MIRIDDDDLGLCSRANGANGVGPIGLMGIPKSQSVIEADPRLKQVARMNGHG